MGVYSENNPFGAPDAMVDKFIGSAYDKVKFVAERMDLVGIVAKALAGLVGTEPMITHRTVIVNGKLDSASPDNRFSLPQLVDPAMVYSITARVKIGANAYCFNDDRFFNVSLEDGQLVLILRDDAPVEFANASVRWFVIHGV